MFNREGMLARALAKSLPRKYVKLAAWKKMLAGLPPAEQGLDIGTGYGGISSFLTQEGHWTYLDLDATRLKVSASVLRGTFVAQSAGPYLTEHLAAFDRIHMVDSIFYFGDWTTIVRDTRNALVPGGFAVVSGMQSHPGDWLMALRTKYGMVASVAAVADIEREELESEFEACGFQIVDSKFYLGPFSLALQSVADAWLLRRSTGGEALTYRIEQNPKWLGLKLTVLFLVRQVSRVGHWLDLLTPFLRRYGYIVIVRRPPKPTLVR